MLCVSTEQYYAIKAGFSPLIALTEHSLIFPKGRISICFSCHVMWFKSKKKCFHFISVKYHFVEPSDQGRPRTCWRDLVWTSLLRLPPQPDPWISGRIRRWWWWSNCLKNHLRQTYNFFLPYFRIFFTSCVSMCYFKMQITGNYWFKAALIQQ